MLRILKEDGEPDPSWSPDLPDTALIEMYAAMLRTRLFDDRVFLLQREGRLGTYAQVRGQEAAQIGSAFALGPTDWVVPAYRESGVLLCRGIPMQNILLYWGGDERGMLGFKAAVSRAALATHMDEIDVTALVAHAGAAHDAPGLLAWIVKGVAQTLQRHPRFNATLDDVHEEMVLRQYVSIGIAIDTTDGLMVPVIRDVAHKSVADIAAEAEQLSAACRQRTIDIGAMRGGTFSVSNIGSLGGIFATPIPNYPEVAILATGRITERLSRAADGNIVSRYILPVSLSFDHRVVDGADAARFANTLREILAEPEGLS
ncbi:MAG: 2-oxo acid dehydrogenase subunit E2 [Candidatus Binatia bacterium]